jgi:hypothetical protein
MKDEQGLREELLNSCFPIYKDELEAILAKHHSPVKESLAELADRKGTMLNAIGTQITGGKWFILINSRRFLEPTYAEAEQSAREYLEGLEDRV